MNTAIFEDYPHCQDAHDYALDVVAGKIPNCQNIVRACQRYLNDLEREDFQFFFDVEKAERAVKFVETMPHTKGKWLAQKLLLTMEPWQKFFLVNIFGWVDEEGYRRFRQVYAAMPRKSGKSALAAAIGHLMFADDDEAGAEVYCGATNEKQSMEVFQPARIMAKKKPDFREYYGVEVNARSIVIPSDGSKFEPVIGNPGDGSSPHLWIVDEYHEHPDSSQVDTAISGMGARDQPILLIITTAGTDTSGPCYAKHREMERVLDGTFQGEDTERLFGLMYGIDDNDDWMQLETVIKANPNYGVSVKKEYLKTQLASAIRNPADQNRFLIKHLNKWVNAKAAWLTAKAWSDCGDDALNEADFSEMTAIGALDLASKRDICSYMRVYYVDKDNGRNYYAFGHHFLPSERIEDESNNSYSAWVTGGFLTIAGEHETDLDMVEDHVSAFLNVGNVREVTYDQWKATQMAQRLEKLGATVVEFKQNAQMMSPAMDELEAAIYSGRFHHDNCPVLSWMASNVVLKPFKTDFFTPTKEKPHLKIDGMVALIMGVGRAMYDGDGPENVYDNRGVREL